METAQHNFKMEGRRVLVLDASFAPVAVVNWQDAFTMLYAGLAKSEDNRKHKPPQVIEYSRDGAVVGVRRNIRVPSVIQLGDIVPTWKRRVRFCRKSIFSRDGFVCQYCGHPFMSEDLTYEHVVPRSQGGKTTWENVVTACVDCNQKKANRTPEQANMRLLRKPRKPSHVLEVSVKMDLRQVPEEWQPYWDQTLLEG